MSRFFSERMANVVPYVPGEQPQGITNLIKLNTNENPFPPSPKVEKILKDFNTDTLRRYNDPTAKKLIDTLSSSYGMTSDRTFVGNGSDEVLALIFQAFCPSGATFADITYGFYSVLCGLNNIKQDIIPLAEDYSINVADYKDSNYPVFIANPNAPTGISLPLEKIEELLLQNTDRLVIVDEAYVDFGGVSSVSLLSKYDNLIVVGTFSKSRSLAGARLGYAFSSKEIIADINCVKFAFHPYNVNTLTQLIATAAVEDDQYFKNSCKDVMDIRKDAENRLLALGCSMLGTDANFLFVNPVSVSGEGYYKDLRDKNIIVRYFDKDRLRDFVRVTIGTKLEMDAFITATEEILNKGE